MTEHIFISYARQDGLSFAERLEADLQKAGRRVWRDRRNLDPHQDFTAELEKAIESASHVAVCLTPDTKRDDSFVRREIGYALACQKPIIPLVMVANVIPPIHIVNLTRIDFHQQVWTQAFNELLARLQLSTSQYEAATPPDDPFRDYLNRCYQEIIAYLDTTVFSLIALHAQSAPGQVQPEEIRRSLPVGFTGLSVKPSKTQADEQPRAFDTFAEAFDYYNGRVLLLGEPGAGKTTTLMAFARNAIAQRLSDPTQPLPLLAAISTWDANQQPPLAEWLAAMADLDVEKVHQLLVDGRTLLLLDALDELGNERQDPETKDRFDPRLKFISLILTNNRVLISCRIKDYAELGTKTILNGAITLQPLDDAQLAEYLHDHPDLWEAVQTDDGLRDMARTPLLLSLFAFAYQGMGEKARELRNLKHSPGDLRDAVIQTYIEQRYERERTKPNVELPFTFTKLQEILGRVALENVGRSFDTENVLKLADFAWLFKDGQAEAFVNFACFLNLLSPIGDELYRFTHLLIRDFFAYETACYLLDSEFDPTRIYAINVLRKINDERSVDKLIDKLKDPYWRVRFQSAIVLGELQSPKSVEALLLILNHDDNIDVQAMAALALGKIGDQRAVDSLINLLSDSDIDLLFNIIRALERIGTPKALAAVEEWRREHG